MKGSAVKTFRLESGGITNVRTFGFTLTGITPLILHADSIEWADQMEAWKSDPNNKKGGKAGDDRSPAFRWIGSLYRDETQLVMPADNLGRCLMSAAARVPIPGGKNGKTFKQDSMAGMSIDGAACPLLVCGSTIPWSSIAPLLTETDYTKHQAAAAALGFELFAKRARIGTNKHVRVRPRFKRWGVVGTVQVWDERLEKSLAQIFDIAGSQMGLGDWRPSGSTPGPFGRFTAEVSLA